TKRAVAPELPPRLEQVLWVELTPEQADLYRRMEQEGERQLLDLAAAGAAESSLRLAALTQLLRLRQICCDPRLVATLPEQPTAAVSAKLEACRELLAEAVDDGHRLLVFSQFTSFLALVKTRLDEAGVRYEYLDGRTRDRGARVARFQSAEGAPVFLISLKAGGHGLNLTAAEYVYLLDPWWNPAVEAQAIDRAHRIGQLRHVLATRVVARDTIESKILELQASKRALADAILGEDKGGLGAIGRAELELLFG
ncbi:MAG: DEAD/DEAH box helicase, partial [Gemmatimonas sp.]